MKVTVFSANQLPEELLTRWAEIQQKHPDLGSPFFCPGFTQAVAAVRNDAQVAVINGGEAFFPFQRSSLGFGRPIGGAVSDYHGLIAPPGKRYDLVTLMRACKLLNWDFDHVPASQEDFSPWQTIEAKSYILDISSDQQVVSKETRSRYSSKLRKLERDFGEIEFEMECNDPEIVRLCLSLKSSQYRRSGVIDLFSMPWAQALAETIAAKQEPSFAGVTSVLRAGRRPVAIHFGMRSKTTWHYWFPAYDIEFGRYSPGMLLLLKMISRAPEMNIKAIDFGKGDTDYKRQLSNRTVPLIEGSAAISRSLVALRQSQRDLTEWVRRAPFVQMIPARLRKVAWRAQEWARFR
ncbi:GNAT family N-acetyltransferase [Microvirga mediterraneensis]|uniref:GNAT family N-acetyltransferase n=1 Tax=Microvirga mediterraneensis TaxID=2754695 RepID=A0A838BQV0_9HYPH|nr:GNAT family N-acetyltransferase [Microvirga mediterraneensis]MBA1157449.1 GNAT family N-acetyltransferase [Microvirga mediterraneensis]